jgi:predicted transglutaminase-like cysteine proteinase
MGGAAQQGARELLQLQRELRPLSDEQRLQQANHFFNQRISFATDLELWGREDHWASPLELMSRRRGDCEDYAIAKFASLLAAGVAEHRLRLTYGRISQGTQQQAHLLLVYQADAESEPLVLDNLSNEVRGASQRGDVLPLFSFNRQALWMADGTPGGDPLQRLLAWREVVAKLRDEGLP